MIDDVERMRLLKRLGARLRELRGRAKLTQQALAVAMGREGKGGHFVVGRLERGLVPNPGLVTVAEFLRGCRAGLSDIQSVMDEFTSLPPRREVATRAEVKLAVFTGDEAVDERTVKYDERLALARADAGREPDAPARRVARAVRYSEATRLARAFSERLWHAVHNSGAYVESANKPLLANHGFAVRRLLRDMQHKSEEERRLELDRLLAQMLQNEKVPEKSVRTVHRAAIAACAGAAAEVAEDAALREQGIVPRRVSKRELRKAYLSARLAALKQIQGLVRVELRNAGIKLAQEGPYLSCISAVAGMVDRLGSDPQALALAIEELVRDPLRQRRTCDPAIVRRVAETARLSYAELRKSLPPEPPPD